jgi:hypothetical protein
LRSLRLLLFKLKRLEGHLKIDLSSAILIQLWIKPWPHSMLWIHQVSLMLLLPLKVSLLLRRCSCLLQMEKFFKPQLKKSLTLTMSPEKNDLDHLF